MIQTQCCEEALPETLIFRIGGTCSGAGDYTLVYAGYSGGIHLWIYTPGGTMCPEAPVTEGDWIIVRCEDDLPTGVWGIFVHDALITPASITIMQCNPFLIEGTLDAGAIGCTCGNPPFQIFDPAFPP